MGGGVVQEWTLGDGEGGGGETWTGMNEEADFTRLFSVGGEQLVNLLLQALAFLATHRESGTASFNA